MVRGSEQTERGRRTETTSEREREDKRKRKEIGAFLFIAFYSFRVASDALHGSAMAEGIIMVNERTTLRLLS